jgi:6-phosphogluconolactonase
MKVNKIVDLSTQALIATVIDKSVASVAHNWKLGKSAHLVLTGGRTGVQLAQTLDTEIFRLITSPEFLSSNSREPFQLHIWFSDERFTSLEDNERTDTKLINAFEKNVDNPRISIIFHRVSSPEVLSLTEAANAYAAELDDLLTGSNFDAVLLSMGEDGHIASLFPGLSTTAHSTKSAVPVDNSPKPPAQRVSIGVDRLAAASAIYIFALGEGKREALTNFEQRSQGPVSLLVEAGRFGQMFIVTDQKI